MSTGVHGKSGSPHGIYLRFFRQARLRMWLKLSGPLSLSFAEIFMPENDFGLMLLLYALIFGSL